MKYALVNMHILDGTVNMEPVSGKAILVDGETIRDIVPDTAVPEEYSRIDLEGRYLLPGLINLHVHLPATGKPKKKSPDYNKIAKLLRFAVVRAVIRQICRNSAMQALLSGTTTIRAVGGVLDVDTGLRDRINRGEIQGPRVLAANYAVSVPGGHMTGSVALPVHSPEEAAAMVRELAETKPDLIKLMITGGVLDCVVPGEPGILKMPAEYVKAAVDQAHALGLPVAAHVESTQGMKVALENGVDTLEHGGKIDLEIIEAFRKTGSVLVTTLSPALPFALMPPDVIGASEVGQLNGRVLFANMQECARRCLRNGIPVGLGTDTGCPTVTHYGMWRELWYFAHYCDVTPAFAIHTATQVNAQIAGINGKVGTVEKGKCADFMVVRRNPLKDLTALRTPTMVVCRGEILRDPKPKKYRKLETMLDQIMEMEKEEKAGRARQ